MIRINTIDIRANRSLTVDVFKGLLIICVVIGHAFAFNDVRYIYWFHMPAFFMVSGFFLKESPNRDEIKKKVLRLVIPYITFSMMLGFLARRGHILATGFYTLYGGFKNTTEYTGPYYFINALFIAIMLFYLGEWIVRKNKVLSKHKQISIFGYCLILYLISHIADMLLPSQTYQMIPWAIDDALCVTIFLCIGKYMYNALIRIRGGQKLALLVLCIAIVVLDQSGIVHFDFDLKYHRWTIGLDILIPSVMSAGIFIMSDIISKIKPLSYILAFLGQACMIIFYLHQFFLHTLREQLGMTNTWLIITLAIVLSSTVYLVLINPKFISEILLGKVAK